MLFRSSAKWSLEGEKGAMQRKSGKMSKKGQGIWVATGFTMEGGNVSGEKQTLQQGKTGELKSRRSGTLASKREIGSGRRESPLRSNVGRALVIPKKKSKDEAKGGAWAVNGINEDYLCETDSGLKLKGTKS